MIFNIIVLSFLVLKLLPFYTQKLASFGFVLEFFLNFLSINSFSGLFLRGKLVMPESTSENYLSFIGLLDRRINLDKMVTSEEDEEKYNATLSIMSSKLAYENPARIKYVVENLWNMKYLGFNNYWNEYQKKETTKAFIMSTDKTSTTSNGRKPETTVVVAFRGTEPFNTDNWSSDLDLLWNELPHIGGIHGGFLKALGLQQDFPWPKQPLQNPNRLSPLAYYSIRDTLKSMIDQNDNTKFVLTGHSLGGALAILFVAVLVIHEETELLERLQGVYTFGQPRVGNTEFGNYMEKKLGQYNIKYYRFVYNNDIVPRLPYEDTALMFKHFGTCIHFDRHYQAKVMREDSPDKDYYSYWGGIREWCSAVMELKRSFTIVSEKGPEFKEGWLMKLGRVSVVLGLLILPGVMNHTSQDYVNSIILSPPSVFHIHGDK